MATSTIGFGMSTFSASNLRFTLRFPWILNSKCFSSLKAGVNKADLNVKDGEQEFRVLELDGKKVNTRDSRRRTKGRSLPTLPPRTTKMPVDQDWASTWPVAKTFHPASVPLPLHQGWVEPGETPPGKFANAELMKIPNFLHLTPPAIQRHCEALKKFCTKWPENLETEEEINKHFPVEFVTSDYCHSSPVIRDSRARIVTLQVKLDSLPLDDHAKDKLLRLVKERYNKDTKILSLIAERCPLRKQNKDYAIYLLNVLVSESWKREPWENEKSTVDMEHYVWEGSPSHVALQSYLEKIDKIENKPEVTSEKIKKYADSITALLNQGEDVNTVSEYKESVKAILGMH
nr:EOG090X09BG [Cyclestheria hislopi]